MKLVTLHRNLTEVHDGHIDRVDSTIATLVRQSAIQPLLDHIAALEAHAESRNGNGEP